MKTDLLPNYAKKIAIPIGVLCLTGLLLLQILSDFLGLPEEMLQEILKHLILVSLLLLVFSKEKAESADIERLRNRQAIEALGFGVVVLILDFLSELIYWDNILEMKTAYELMIMILLYYLILFYIRKNITYRK